MKMRKKFIVLAAVAALALSALGVESWAQLTQPPTPPDWDPVFGTDITTDPAFVGDPDDGYLPVTLPAPGLPFFGTNRTNINISTNGIVSFGTPTGAETATADYLNWFGMTDMVAAIFGDWDPTDASAPAGAGTYWKQRADGTVVATWVTVPEFGTIPPGVNTFQTAIYPNGCIRLSYNGLTTDGFDSLVGDPMVVGVSNRGTAPGSTQTILATGDAALTSMNGLSAINSLDHASVYLWWDPATNSYQPSDLPCEPIAHDSHTLFFSGEGYDFFLFPRPSSGGGFILYGPTSTQTGSQKLGDVVCSGTGAIKNFAQVRVWFGLCNEDPTKILTAFNRTNGPMTVYLRSQGRGPVTPTPPLVLASVDQRSQEERVFELQPRPLELKAQRSGDGSFQFVAQGRPVQDFGVEIYSLSGKLVYDSGLVRGTSLRWAGLSNDGRPVANGVYLYVLKARDSYGRIIKTEVRKLVLLR